MPRKGECKSVVGWTTKPVPALRKGHDRIEFTLQLSCGHTVIRHAPSAGASWKYAKCPVCWEQLNPTPPLTPDSPEAMFAKALLEGLGFRIYNPPGELDAKFVAGAKQHWLLSDGTLEVDDNAVVSMGDDPGAYVQAWLWVTNEDAGIPEEDECEEDNPDDSIHTT